MRPAILAKLLRSAVLCFPVFLVACGGTNSSSNSNPITNPPPVNAQTTYSNAALSGTYSISAIAAYQGVTGLASYQGTAQFDGNGNITAISFTDYAVGNSCTFTGTGTYSVASNATGTVNLTINTPITVALYQNTCTFVEGSSAGISLNFKLEAAQQGASFLLTPSGAQTYLYSITALKQ